MFEFPNIEEVKGAIEGECDSVFHYDQQWFYELKDIPMPQSDMWGLTDAVAVLAARYSHLLLQVGVKDEALRDINEKYWILGQDYTLACERSNRIWAIEKVISFQERLQKHQCHLIHTTTQQ